MRVRSGFNSAVFFTVCGLLIAVIAAGTTDGAADGPLRDDPRCSVSLSMFLENSNGSFTHDGMVYPPDVRWTDGNFTYGCICRLRWCIRKCCRRGEVIRRDLRNRPLCEKVPREDFATNSSAKTPALHLAREQLAKEIRDISELREHFVLIEARGEVCPGPLFALNEDDGEEKVTLRANGDLLTNTLDKILRPWDYCIDWRMTLDKISILACVPPDIDTVQPSEQQNTVHKVGIIISIPFLIATFLVYAITPELRNLYGKTLMCYVICLITAYVFLILATYIYISPYFLCIGTGKGSSSSFVSCLSRIRSENSSRGELGWISQMEATNEAKEEKDLAMLLYGTTWSKLTIAFQESALKSCTVNGWFYEIKVNIVSLLFSHYVRIAFHAIPYLPFPM